MLDQENKNFEMLSVTMKEQFDVQITNYDPKDYEVAVSFLEMKNIRHFLMYSVIYVATTCLKKSYWEVYTEKLPKMYLESVPSSWLHPQQSCLHPYINTKIFRPEKHWCSVQEEKKGMRKTI